MSQGQDQEPKVAINVWLYHEGRQILQTHLNNELRPILCFKIGNQLWETYTREMIIQGLAYPRGHLSA